MKHNGVGFTVVQGIRRGYFVWMAETDPPRQGEAQGRDSAMENAQRSIDNWLALKKRLACARLESGN